MPNDKEIQRILGLSDAEILAQMKRDGINPHDIVRKGRAMLDRAIKQVDDEDFTVGVERIQNAIPTHAAGWLPIATAPRDGSVFLACTDEVIHPKPKLCWRDGDRWLTTGKPEKFVDPMPHRWWPTHWMPMPDTSALPSQPRGSEAE